MKNYISVSLVSLCILFVSASTASAWTLQGKSKSKGNSGSGNSNSHDSHRHDSGGSGTHQFRVNNFSGNHDHGNNRSYLNLNQGGLSFGTFGQNGGFSIHLPLGGSDHNHYGGPGMYHGDRYGGVGGFGPYGQAFRSYSVPYQYGSPPGSRSYSNDFYNDYYNDHRFNDYRYRPANPYANDVGGFGDYRFADPANPLREPSGLVRSYKPPVDLSVPTLIATAYDAKPDQIRAESAFRAGDYLDAVRFSNEALLADQNNGMLMLFASQVNFAVGYYDQSVNEIEEAARLIDDQRMSYVVRNYQRFYGRDDYVDQMERLNRHIERHPNDVRALVVRGFQFGGLGYADAASQDFAAALRIKPDFQIAVRLDYAVGQRANLNPPVDSIGAGQDSGIAPDFAPQNEADFAPAVIDNPTAGYPQIVPPAQPRSVLPPPSGFEPGNQTAPEESVHGVPDSDIFLPSENNPSESNMEHDNGTGTSVLIDPTDGG